MRAYPDLEPAPDFEREARRGAAHLERLERLQRVGADVDRELRDRVYSAYYKPVSEEQEALDEAAIARLEADAAPLFSEHERKRRAEIVKRCDFPITASDVSLLARGELEETRALTGVRDWHSTDSPLLALAGPCGRGKTLAACGALVNTREGRYVRAPDISRLFLASFGDEIEERAEIVRTRGLLVVDDIGTERSAEAMAVALLEMIDARRRGARSIWITNMDRRAFEARYPDARLHSRLAQSCTWFVDAGADMRKARATAARAERSA